MDPVSKEIFSYDFHRFVTQDLNAVPPLPAAPVKKFEVKPAKKTDKPKKDQDKQPPNERDRS